MPTEFVATAGCSTSTCTSNPAFDVVHPLGCTTCLHYMRHRANAGPSATDSSFQGALRECDGHSTIGSLHGFFSGTAVHLEESCRTAELISQYRDQRDEALELANRRAAELQASKEESHRLQEQLRALQVLFDEMVEFAASEKSISNDRMTRLENILLGSSHDPQEAEEPFTPEPRLPPIDASRLPTPPVSPARRRSSLPTLYSTPESLPAPAPPIIDIPPQERPQLSPADEIYQRLLNTSPDESTAYVAHSFAKEGFDTSAFDISGGAPELNELMDDTRDGDAQALLRINELYMEAHLTPSRGRASLQQFLIHEWKDVRPSLLTPSTPTPPSPAPSLSESDTPEIFVDASGWGVGFVLNGRWLAWKLKPGWRREGRDNNWAEMVAVELGLHVAIAAGFHSQTIVMRSDNWGVVRSILRGKSRHATQPEILQKIMALARRCDVDLIPVWVPTKENPADKPSRGVFPPKALRFPISIPLPAHLTPFLGPSI